MKSWSSTRCLYLSDDVDVVCTGCVDSCARGWLKIFKNRFGRHFREMKFLPYHLQLTAKVSLTITDSSLMTKFWAGLELLFAAVWAFCHVLKMCDKKWRRWQRWKICLFSVQKRIKNSCQYIFFLPIHICTIFARRPLEFLLREWFITMMLDGAVAMKYLIFNILRIFHHTRALFPLIWMIFQKNLLQHDEKLSVPHENSMIFHHLPSSPARRVSEKLFRSEED